MDSNQTACSFRFCDEQGSVSEIEIRSKISMIKFASPACCAFHQFKAASLLDSGRFGISAYSQLNVAAFASLRLALRPCVQARCNATQRLQVRLVTFCHLVSLRRADHSWMPQCQTPTARFGADVQMHVMR